MLNRLVPTQSHARPLTAVYPSQKAWDDLLRSIDEKAAVAERLINGVLEQQARAA